MPGPPRQRARLCAKDGRPACGWSTLRSGLESSLDGNLERSWAALVVERAGIPEALIEHLGGLAKKKVREGRIDIPEVGMIEDVERLNLQLHIHYFPKMVRLPDTKIPLHFREAAEEI